MSQEQRDLQKFLRWWVVACLAVIALNLMGCASGTAIVPMQFGNPLKGGQTICDISGKKPVILVNQMYVGTPKEAVIVAHEEVHASQMYRMGCKKASERYAHDNGFAFSMEAEAFCADMALQERTDPTFNKREFIDTLVMVLAHVYPFGMTEDEVRKRLPCK